MKMTSVVLILAIFLVGCSSDEADIQDAIKDRLNDPLSAQFKNMLISKNGIKACTGWTAKNRVGGYAGWRYASLRKIESTWVVENMDKKRSRFCTKSHFASYDSYDEITKKLKSLQ